MATSFRPGTCARWGERAWRLGCEAKATVWARLARFANGGSLPGEESWIAGGDALEAEREENERGGFWQKKSLFCENRGLLAFSGLWGGDRANLTLLAASQSLHLPLA